MAKKNPDISIPKLIKAADGSFKYEIKDNQLFLADAAGTFCIHTSPVLYDILRGDAKVILTEHMGLKETFCRILDAGIDQLAVRSEISCKLPVVGRRKKADVTWMVSIEDGSHTCCTVRCDYLDIFTYDKAYVDTTHTPVLLKGATFAAAVMPIRASNAANHELLKLADSISALLKNGLHN